MSGPSKAPEAESAVGASGRQKDSSQSPTPAPLGPWHHGDERDVDFVGIGSVMNPHSVRGRGITPLGRSQGCELLDFEFFFSGGDGMASARRKPGKSLHGVLHRFTAAEMRLLDESEGLTTARQEKKSGGGGEYEHAEGRVRLYSGEIRRAHVYVVEDEEQWLANLREEKRTEWEQRRPSERYLTMMIEGCKHYGVAPEWIAWLEKQPFSPRKLFHEFLRYEVPSNLPTWGLEELARGDGQEGRPIYVALNGKVIEFLGPREGPMYEFMIERHIGADMTLARARRMYDPKYGLPETLEDMSEEHRAAVEDLRLTFKGMFALKEEETERVVALLLPQKNRGAKL